MSAQRIGDEGLIGELMLAKAVLEERGELLDREDAAVRSLRSREAALRAELVELREEKARLLRRLGRLTGAARARGVFEAVSAVLGELAPLEPPPAAEAARGGIADLIATLCAGYGLEVIGAASEPLDPQRHRVIERRVGQSACVEVLQRGYGLAGRVVRPALVRVTTPAPAVEA